MSYEYLFFEYLMKLNNFSFNFIITKISLWSKSNMKINCWKKYTDLWISIPPSTLLIVVMGA